MRQLIAPTRLPFPLHWRRPGPLAGTLVALTAAATMVTTIGALMGTGFTVKPPTGRLTGAAVLVAGNPNVYGAGHGDAADGDNLLLPAYRRLPADLAGRIAAVPGVAKAVADVSFPVGLVLPGEGGRGGGWVDGGTGAAPLAGHGWASAALTPFRLVAGSPPAGRTGIVVGSAVAAADHLRPGDRVRLTGAGTASPFTVTGVAAAPPASPSPFTAAAPSGRDSVFFDAAEAAALYGHPGQADLIGVVARPGTTAAALAARIRRAVPRADTVATGPGRGALADVAAAGDATQFQGLATGVGVDIVLTALFVVAGTVALSVGLRRRQFALLRAVGATGGQVRRAVSGELAVLGVLGGMIGFLPGQWLASLAVRGFVRNNLLPVTAQAWRSPWLLLAGCGIGVIVAELSGFIAARRAGRANPADALRESFTERWWPHPVRIVLGLAALGGSITLLTVTLGTNQSNQLNLAFPLLLAMMGTVALLGPLLVALAELVLRLPARAFGGVSGRLAMADVAARPRRIASAVIPVTLCVAMVGTVYTVNATVTHTAITQGRQRLVADDVLTAPGPGLAPATLAAVRAQPGVRTAVGLASANIAVLDPDLESDSGEVVTDGSLASVLAPGVAAGSLAGFGPGDVAISTQEAGAGLMGVHVGGMATVYLPDGTPYRARVTALYSRSLGFGDALIPAAAAAGHLGSGTYAQILVRGNGQVSQSALAAELGKLSGRFPGLTVASRSVSNAQAEQQNQQDSFINNIILLVIVLLAGVSLVNTLVVATVERREELRLLGRVGATRRQLSAVTGWQALMVSVTGMLLGAVAGVATLGCVSRALTGNWVPYITAPSVLVLVGAVLALTLAATLGPATAIMRAGRTA